MILEDRGCSGVFKIACKGGVVFDHGQACYLTNLPPPPPRPPPPCKQSLRVSTCLEDFVDIWKKTLKCQSRFDQTRSQKRRCYGKIWNPWLDTKLAKNFLGLWILEKFTGFIGYCSWTSRTRSNCLESAQVLYGNKFSRPQLFAPLFTKFLQQNRDDVHSFFS